jgi:hypothetical protein
VEGTNEVGLSKMRQCLLNPQPLPSRVIMMLSGFKSGSIDLTHSTHPERFENFIWANSCAGGECHWSGLAEAHDFRKDAYLI